MISVSWTHNSVTHSGLMYTMCRRQQEGEHVLRIADYDLVIR